MNAESPSYEVMVVKIWVNQKGFLVATSALTTMFPL